MADDRGKPEKPYSDDVTAFLPKAMPPRQPAGSQRSIPLGSMLGKYRIDGILGRGGGGDVYAAEDPVIQRKVAIKLLPPELAQDETLLSRFRAEAQAAGKLNHPHVVTIYEVMEVDGSFAIVMELLTGGSVQEYLKRKGSPGWRAATRLAAEACKALMAAHEVGLIHRDIKPANLLLTNDRHVKVADFGLAKFEAAGATMHTQAGTILGTPAFMSPEQCRGDKIDARTDIYSLGCTYFAMLTGKPPFEAASSMQVMFSHCSAPIPDPCELNADTPRECAQILVKALAKDPNDRYATARDMFNDLRAVLGGATLTNANMLSDLEQAAAAATTATAASEPRLYEPPARRGDLVDTLLRRKWTVGIAAAAVLALLIGGAIVALLPGHSPPPRESNPGPLAAPPHTDGTDLAAAPLPTPAHERSAASQPAVSVPVVIPATQAAATAPASMPLAPPPPIVAPIQAAHAPASAPATQTAAASQSAAQTRPAIAFDAERLKMLPARLTNSLQQELVLIRPGKFLMGDNSLPDAPRHEVTLTKPFYMGVCEVTSEEFAQLMGDDTHRHMLRRDVPEAFATWEDAAKFCTRLNDRPQEKAAGHVYRLPTEAEWEYACRAGTTTRFTFGDTLDKEHANFGRKIDLATLGRPADNAGANDGPTPNDEPSRPPPGPRGGRPPGGGGPGQRPDPAGQRPAPKPQPEQHDQHPLDPVGSYPANAWGLKDMTGNIWEWCSDFYSLAAYKAGAQTDPTGPETGAHHVARGGCWSSTAEQCGSAYRNGAAEPTPGNPAFGFRIVMDIAPAK